MYAVVLCVAAPDKESKLLTLRDALADAVAGALDAVRASAGELGSGERASLRLCLGNAAAGAAEFRPNDAFLTFAGSAVRGVATRNLGAVLHAIAEPGCDEDMLNECARLYRDAMTMFTRQGHPDQWAALQNRLGLVLLRLDRATGDTELVKEALSAFQAALQVRKRGADPLKWAEVMNNIGQAAVLLGGQLRNAEALEKAAGACRGALEERTRERMPVAWATAQNNPGSALFLLGKLRREISVVEAAAAPQTARAGRQESRPRERPDRRAHAHRPAAHGMGAGRSRAHWNVSPANRGDAPSRPTATPRLASYPF